MRIKHTTLLEIIEPLLAGVAGIGVGAVAYGLINKNYEVANQGIALIFAGGGSSAMTQMVGSELRKRDYRNSESA